MLCREHRDKAGETRTGGISFDNVYYDEFTPDAGSEPGSLRQYFG